MCVSDNIGSSNQKKYISKLNFKALGWLLQFVTYYNQLQLEINKLQLQFTNNKFFLIIYDIDGDIAIICS